MRDDKDIARQRGYYDAEVTKEQAEAELQDLIAGRGHYDRMAKNFRQAILAVPVSLYKSQKRLSKRDQVNLARLQQALQELEAQPK